MKTHEEKTHAANRKSGTRQAPTILSRREIARFASKLQASEASELLLPAVMMIEDLLWDKFLGEKEWQAGIDYLAAEDHGEGFRWLIDRVIAALGRGDEGRRAARWTLRRILEIGYDLDPVTSPESHESLEVVQMLRESLRGPF